MILPTMLGIVDKVDVLGLSINLSTDSGFDDSTFVSGGINDLAHHVGGIHLIAARIYDSRVPCTTND